eukprot:238023-Pyramimonas_sp.AAC.1
MLLAPKELARSGTCQSRLEQHYAIRSLEVNGPKLDYTNMDTLLTTGANFVETALEQYIIVFGPALCSSKKEKPQWMLTLSRPLEPHLTTTSCSPGV